MRQKLLLSLIATSMILLCSSIASADERVRCESTDGHRRRCAHETLGRVTISRQLSISACVEGESWGYDDEFIWVTDGCRAEFLIEGDREGRDREGDHDRGEHYDRDRYRTITCESKDNRNHLCEVDTRFGVELTRQLSISDCTYRSSWGYNDRGVWVSNGCRAEFTIRIR